MEFFKQLLTFKIARHALGKYLILYATLLHLFWAVLLCIDIRAANATALSILFILLGGSRLLVIEVLVAVAFMSTLFLNLRLRAVVGMRWLALLLVPQQMVLLCSAGAGIYATIIQRYADLVVRSWAHIAADQATTILTAVLYTTAVVEATRAPVINEH